MAPADRSESGIEAMEPRTHLLLLRFLLVNLAALALFLAAVFQGWVAEAVESDTTGLTVVIFGVFVVGTVMCGFRVFQTGRALEEVRRYDPAKARVGIAARYLARVYGRGGESRALAAANLRLRLQNRIATVRHIANSLVFLGLIGTVLGFIIALSGVKPELASDVGAVAPMVSTLVEGMAVALYTTLMGAVGNLWLMANYRLLASGTASLFHNLVELGERYAGA